MPVKRKGGMEACGERIPNDAPQVFGLDGKQYEGDFCTKHQEDLRASMAPFVAVSRDTRSRAAQTVRAALKGKKGTFTTKDVRKWLEEQGRDVASSGRLPNELIDEYRAAHANH